MHLFIRIRICTHGLHGIHSIGLFMQLVPYSCNIVNYSCNDFQRFTLRGLHAWFPFVASSSRSSRPYLIRLGDHPSLPPWPILLLLTARLLALVNIEITVHLVLCVSQIPFILIISWFLLVDAWEMYLFVVNDRHCYSSYLKWWWTKILLHAYSNYELCMQSSHDPHHWSHHR